MTTKPGFDGDRFYAALLAAHEGLSDAESHALNARLVLLFADHIGEADTLEALLERARLTAPSTP